MKAAAGLFLAMIVLLTSLSGQARYSVLYDQHQTPVTNAENLSTLHRGTYELTDRVIPARFLNEDDVSSKALGISYRLVKSFLVENIIDYFFGIYTHEVGGHGWRYREYGYTNRQYSLNFAPPYGPGGGKARATRPVGLVLPYDERISVSTAGMEANQVFSKNIRGRFLKRGSMHYREAVLYFMTVNDLTRYILATRYQREGGDVRAYLATLNAREGYFTSSNRVYNLNALTNQSLVSFLNPFQYFTLYAMFGKYLYSGDTVYEYPMLDVWGAKYLPSVSFALTPFGGEYQFENLFIHSGRVVQLTIRYGHPTFHKFWGIGVSASDLFRNGRVSMDASLHVWNQPGLALQNNLLSRLMAVWEERHFCLVTSMS